MVITYKANLLQQILNRHKVEPIDYVHLDEEEFIEVVDNLNALDEGYNAHPENSWVAYKEITFYNGRY